MANPVIAVRVRQDLRDRLDEQAKERGVTLSELVVPVLEEAFGPERAPASQRTASSTGLFGATRLR